MIKKSPFKGMPGMRSDSDSDGDGFDLAPAWSKTKRFSKWNNYSSIFNNLTNLQEIDTKSGIVTLLMTYDTSRVLSVNKIDDE